MTTATRIVPLLLGLLLPATHLVAQGGDPMREIQEIAESVNQQLQEIDELLLESGKKNQSRSKPKELLQKASERSATVEAGIDKLIEKLNEMKQQGGGGGGQSGEQKPQDGQQQGQPRPGGKPGNRRENDNTDFEQQTDQQPGENKPGSEQDSQPQPSGQPKGGQDAKTGGQNEPGNPQQSDTGPGKPGTGEGAWGDLQPYLNFLRNRGASPKVPAKFRKYYEAYLKNKQAGGK